MLKKIMSWMLPYFVYNLVVLTIILLIFLFPTGSDISLLLGWGIYIPYIFYIVYILGFIFGYFVQIRCPILSITLQLTLTIISFVTLILVLSVYIISEPDLFTTFALIPASGSSCLFLIGEIFARYEQKKTSRH